jgi:phosphoglycolate phosphatase
MPDPQLVPEVPIAHWRAVLFDLDGTLIDTLQDIATSVNEVLARHALAAHPVDAYRDYVGDGVAMLVTRALPLGQREQPLIDQCVRQFGEVYQKNWNVHSRPYDGVHELLSRLAEARIPMAILSNKPQEFTEKCVREYLPEAAFAAIFGQRDSIPRKPAPDSAQIIAHQLGVATHEFVYLGDSSVDMQTACRANMYPVGAGWGFRSRGELQDSGAAAIIDHPRELLALPGFSYLRHA